MSVLLNVLANPQTFGATAFSSYGGFWFSFAALYIPQFGIAGE
jgi:succinate-acetate transporter protein